MALEAVLETVPELADATSVEPLAGGLTNVDYKVVSRLGTFAQPLLPARRLLTAGELSLPGVHGCLPAEVYVWPAPATYTGQELVAQQGFTKASS